MTTLADITRIFAEHQPPVIQAVEHSASAVALILREGARGVELLFIERAAHDGDPWSGDIGFPGGRFEDTDPDLQSTAERETLEELALDLCTARPLGMLSEIIGAHLPIRVSCYVYAIEDLPPLQLSHEVVDTFWVSLADLADPARHVTAPVRFGGDTFRRPAILLPVPDKPVLWGITYRLVMDFMELLP